MSGFDVFAVVFVLLVIVTLLAGIKTVPQGYDWTIERFGKYTQTLSPGLNLIVPYFDRIGRKMNMMEQVISIPEQEVITKDNRIEIKDIVPPADLVEAMGRQMKAERVKRADILQAEGQRQSEILRAEGAKQGQILQAEGRREAAFRDAEARERLAEAEAKATQMVSDAIAKGDVAALNYFIADKYIRAFGQFASSPNQKVLMLPVEAMSMLGALAGIGEIAKATFGESAASAAAAAHRTSVPTAGPNPPPMEPEQ